MHHRKVFVPALIALVLGAVPALADAFTYPAAKVRFTTPAHWGSKPTDGGGMVTFDPANDTAVAFVAVDDGAVGQASALAVRRLGSMIDNIKVTKEEKMTINGMPAVAIEGDGRRKGVDIDWAVVVVNTPSPTNDLMAIAIAEDAKLAAHRSEIRGIFASITPM
jgi:hypothetical protein